MQPNVLLSLGIGSYLDETTFSSPDFRHVLQDGFVLRLWRSFMSSLNRQTIWRDLWNQLDEVSKDRYFRSNIYLSGSTMAIDDVLQMTELRARVHVSSHLERFRTAIAFALIATTFFFELGEPLLFQCGKLYCKGTIRCRLNALVICNAVTRVHPAGLLFMTESEVLGTHHTGDNICNSCHRYRKYVEFVVRHIDEPFSIFLQSPHLGKRVISGFP